MVQKVMAKTNTPNMKHKLFLLLAVLFSLAAHAQEDTLSMADQYVDKEFVIVRSAKKYADALQTARTAATRLKIKLDLRGLKPNKAIGLSWDKKTCETDWFESPCYVARGRYDDGEYVSIEYSTAYTGFAEGYYIVIIAGGPQGDDAVKQSLRKARTVYKDAYAKRTKVYIGCMH